MIAAILLLLQTTASPPVAVSLVNGDSAFANLNYPVAITAYEEALRLDRDNAAALWRLARVHVIMSEATPPGIDGPLLKKAEQYARHAVSADPRDPQARTWLAGTLGFLAMRAPLGSQVRMANELLAQTDTALALDSSNDVVYSIRGSFYHALGNVGWLKRGLASVFLGTIPAGGYEQSETALLRAVALAPDVMRHKYELGILYMDWGKKEEGRRVLTEAEKLPVRIASDVPRLKRIKELLEK
jgi:tetratricopeptide (TPR) repeat protein